MRPHPLMTAAATALLLWQGGPLDAQETEAQDMARVSVDGNVVELPLELAAEVCGLDVEVLRTDMAALEGGEGRPDPAAEDGATMEADMTDTSAEAPLAATDPDAALETAREIAPEVAPEVNVEPIPEVDPEVGSDTSLDEAEAVDPDATTTNDDVAMASDGDAAGTASPIDPTAPLPTADAVCEIDRLTAEQFGLPAPD